MEYFQNFGIKFIFLKRFIVTKSKNVSLQKFSLKLKILV